MATRFSILALFLFYFPLSMGNPMDRGAWGATVHGVAKSRTQLSTQAHTTFQHLLHQMFWTLLSVRRDGEWLVTFLTDQL